MAYIYDVFLCYNRQDQKAVLQIYEALKDRGLDPWIDQKNLSLGEPFSEEIEKGLKSSCVTVVFVGSHGLSRFQRMEVDIVVNRFQRVIPALLPGGQESSLPYFLGILQWIDFPDGIDDEKRLDRLVSAIREYKKEFLDLPTSTPPPAASFSSEPLSKALDGTVQEAPSESLGPIATPAAAPSWKIGSSLATRTLILLTLVLLLLAQRGSVLPYGTLVLDAVPWGEVSEILDANGKTQTLGTQQITPLVLPLPAGTYKMKLRNQSFPEPVSLNVIVVSGTRVPKVAEFEKPAASKKEFFKELGFREPSL